MTSILDHPPRSSRNQFVEPAGFLSEIYNALPPGVKSAALNVKARCAIIAGVCARQWARSRRRGLLVPLLQWLFSIQTALILLWGVTLYWGERTVFRNSVKPCAWNMWEKWVGCGFFIAV